MGNCSDHPENKPSIFAANICGGEMNLRIRRSPRGCLGKARVRKDVASEVGDSLRLSVRGGQDDREWE